MHRSHPKFKCFKDTLKAFDDFRNKQQNCMKIHWYVKVYDSFWYESKFLICKSMYIPKVYSAHYKLRYDTNLQQQQKNSDKINGTENAFFFLARAPTHQFYF